MHPFVDWSKPLVNPCRTFPLVRKVRTHQFFHRQNWKPYQNANKFNHNPGGNGCNGRNGGYGILWELDKVDRQIQLVQSEIVVLKQQLKIIQTYCAPVQTDQSNQSRY